MAEASVEGLFDEADVVFRGTVRDVAASAMEEVPATDLTAVVTVDEVVHAPTSLRALEGTDITVVLADAEGLRPRGQYLFFVTAWLFGTGIAVREVGRVEADEPEGGARAAARVEETASNAAQRELRRHVEEADLVVAGRVTLVRPSQSAAAAAEERRPITEHDPNWQEAVVEVQSVVSGQLRAPQITVLFPASMDVMWRDAPKHRPGERGVWLLHEEQVPPGVAEAVPNAYAVVHRGDFFGMDRLDEIREVVPETER